MPGFTHYTKADVVLDSKYIVQHSFDVIGKDKARSSRMAEAEIYSEGIQVVELHMMDFKKFIPLSVASGVCVRFVQYPMALVKTRIQIQKQRTVYTGTFDAFSKILQQEGVRGLYKGFWIHNMHTISHIAYISAYEGSRRFLVEKTPLTNSKVRSFISGGLASLSSQLFVAPIDIVAQHLMMHGRVTKQGSQKSRVAHLSALRLSPDALTSRLGATRAVISAIYTQYGLRGFYKGNVISLFLNTTTSASWWFFYDIYCGLLAAPAPDWVPRLALQTTAAPLAGVTVTFLTNPIDITRARLQVQHGTFWGTARTLWSEEKLKIFTKGLTPRIIQSLVFSTCIMFSYETIKRWSLLEQYKSQVRW